MICIGLFLYDYLVKWELLFGFWLIKFDSIDLLKLEIIKGFEYLDGWVDDVCLVILIVKKVEQFGVIILICIKCVKVECGIMDWFVILCDMKDQLEKMVLVKLIVNVFGFWVSSLFGEILLMFVFKMIWMVKGSYIVIFWMNKGIEVYILQNEDECIVFVIFYEDEFFFVGIIDVDYEGDFKKVWILFEEIEYLLDIVNVYFKW